MPTRVMGMGLGLGIGVKEQGVLGPEVLQWAGAYGWGL